MPDVLEQYLSVVPFDLAHSSDFNIYDWARYKIVSEISGSPFNTPPPAFNLVGDEISSEDVDKYLNAVREELQEIM